MDDGDCSINVEVEPDVILDVEEDSDDSGEYDKFSNNMTTVDPLALASPLKGGVDLIPRERKVVYVEPNRLEQCPQCGKYYRRLARHMLKHLKQEEYIKSLTCNLCSETFHKKSMLEVHVKSHTGNKPFVCEVCQKAFSQNCNLINHLRVHTGDKPFKCDFCDKRFTQSGNLKNHLRLHSDEKPFVCSICYQAFRQLSNLNNHSKKHPNFKQSPYKRVKVISIST